MDNLEKITGTEDVENENFHIDLDSDKLPKKRNIYQRVKDAATNYLVDVSAGLIFYNPILIATESLMAGMNSDEILKSRIGASLMQCLTMRPGGMLRNASAQYFGLTKESPWYKKGLSDVACIWSLQIPAYSLALYKSGVSFKEGLTALAMGLLVTGITNNGTRLGFGKWMDFWRKSWGKKQAIK